MQKMLATTLMKEALDTPMDFDKGIHHDRRNPATSSHSNNSNKSIGSLNSNHSNHSSNSPEKQEGEEKTQTSPKPQKDTSSGANNKKEDASKEATSSSAGSSNSTAPTCPVESSSSKQNSSSSLDYSTTKPAPQAPSSFSSLPSSSTSTTTTTTPTTQDPSQQYTTEFIKSLFGPHIGPILHNHTCSKSRHSGRLYIGTHACCFYSNLFGMERKSVLMYDTIAKVEIYRTSSIMFTTVSGEELVFRSFQAREEVVKIVTAFVEERRGVVQHQEEEHQHQNHHQHHQAEEDVGKHHVQEGTAQDPNKNQTKADGAASSSSDQKPQDQPPEQGTPKEQEEQQDQDGDDEHDMSHDHEDKKPPLPQDQAQQPPPPSSSQQQEEEQPQNILVGSSSLVAGIYYHDKCSPNGKTLPSTNTSTAAATVGGQGGEPFKVVAIMNRSIPSPSEGTTSTNQSNSTSTCTLNSNSASTVDGRQHTTTGTNASTHANTNVSSAFRRKLSFDHNDPVSGSNTNANSNSNSGSSSGFSKNASIHTMFSRSSRRRSQSQHKKRKALRGRMMTNVGTSSRKEKEKERELQLAALTSAAGQIAASCKAGTNTSAGDGGGSSRRLKHSLSALEGDSPSRGLTATRSGRSFSASPPRRARRTEDSSEGHDKEEQEKDGSTGLHPPRRRFVSDGSFFEQDGTSTKDEGVKDDQDKAAVMSMTPPPLTPAVEEETSVQNRVRCDTAPANVEGCGSADTNDLNDDAASSSSNNHRGGGGGGGVSTLRGIFGSFAEFADACRTLTGTVSSSRGGSPVGSLSGGSSSSTSSSGSSVSTSTSSLLPYDDGEGNGGDGHQTRELSSSSVMVLDHEPLLPAASPMGAHVLANGHVSNALSRHEGSGGLEEDEEVQARLQDTDMQLQEQQQQKKQEKEQQEMDEEMQRAWTEMKEATSKDFKELAVEDYITPSCTLEQYYNTFLSNQAPHSIQTFQSKVILDSDLSTTSWESCPESTTTSFPSISPRLPAITEQRQITFRHKVNAPVGPSTAKATKVQTCRRYGTCGIALQTKTMVEGVQASDCFYVEDCVLVQPCEKEAKKNGVVVTVRFQVRFVKSTLWKKVIEKMTKSEMNEWFGGYVKMVGDTLATMEKTSGGNDVEVVEEKRKGVVSPKAPLKSPSDDKRQISSGPSTPPPSSGVSASISPDDSVTTEKTALESTHSIQHKPSRFSFAHTISTSSPSFSSSNHMVLFVVAVVGAALVMLLILALLIWQWIVWTKALHVLQLEMVEMKQHHQDEVALLRELVDVLKRDGKGHGRGGWG